VVRVYLRANEGGPNLNMPEATLAKSAQVGERAAGLLASRFAPDSPEAMNFENHRYVRLRDLIGVVEADLSTNRQALLAVRRPAVCNGRCRSTYAFSLCCLKLSTRLQ
jgi:hypothetical protein